MVKTYSTMLDLGTTIDEFTLWDVKQEKAFEFSRDVPESKAYLIMFICNHCPYVVHIIQNLVDNIKNWQQKDVAVIGINSNDIQLHPADSPENMKEWSNKYCFSFPYLFDEKQTVAKYFKAACTPDFYLLDDRKKLVYRGQYDNSRPGNDIPVSGSDLNLAISELIKYGSVKMSQSPSMGCNIKWKPGNEPSYFG